MLQALSAMAEAGLDVTSRSALYESPAFPPGAGPDYVNAVAEVRTRLGPEAALAALHGIEARSGRVRTARWASRILDLDLLALGDLVYPDRATYAEWATLPLVEQARRTPGRLILPHPRIQDRAFVLAPLVEIAPDWVHPVSGLTAREMMEALDPADVARVRPL